MWPGCASRSHGCGSKADESEPPRRLPARRCAEDGAEDEEVDSDYTYIDVEIELDGTKEKDTENAFGELL